jgi:hypothetical protein
MQYQLRIYTALPGHAHDFAREWAEKIVPVRRQYGFDVVGGWVTEDGEKFVWIVGHEDLEAAEAVYYKAPERDAIPDHPRRYLDLDQIEVTLMHPLR